MLYEGYGTCSQHESGDTLVAYLAGSRHLHGMFISRTLWGGLHSFEVITCQLIGLAIVYLIDHINHVSRHV